MNPLSASNHTKRTIRSFVKREGRLTKSQKTALTELWPHYGIDNGSDILDLTELFGRNSNLVIDIGFGNGETLAATALQYPDYNFIGVEVHRPGVGHLLNLLQKQNISNVKVANIDVCEFLQHRIADKSVKQVSIFFPDPWPKKRHHKRRLIQLDFVRLLTDKLQNDGVLHCATDWDDYAEHIKEVMSAQTSLVETNLDSALSRSETKFEKRGKNLDHTITDIVYKMKAIS